MLVLSRKVDEELVFPNLDVRIKVLRTQGNRVRLGIEAPEFVEISRGERPTEQAVNDAADRHRRRNQLNAVKLALELYERQMERGDLDAANRTFLRLIAQLRRADLDQAPSSLGPAEVRGTPRGPKVLVVDDDPHDRELLASLLEMDGCTVETAQDGLEALDALQRLPTPDVVLLDMQMPRLDGKETLAAIRGGDRWRHLLVFAVSGSAPGDYGICVGQQQGVDEWFEKPLNPAALVQRMKQRLQTGTAVSA
jgi:carbon storage regulator CsrA